MSNKRVVIIEFMGSHSECIYSVIEAYKHKGFDVHLVTSNREIKTIGYLEKEVASWQHINWTDSQFKLLLRIFQMRLMIGKIKPQEIFFNTAQGTMVRTLLQLLPKGITKKGFIHNTRKLSGSSTQKTISKYLSKYLVLSEFQKTDASSKTTTPVDVFYPISFYRNKEVKQDSELTLCVVGAMEYKKKDIGFLLDNLDLLVQSRIRIIFAGKIDPNNPELQPLLAKISAIPTVEYYTEFIPDSKLFELIEK